MNNAPIQIFHIYTYSAHKPNFTDTLGIEVPENETGQLELLGVKLISKLNSFQAREVTQYEVGDPHWKSDIQFLQTGILGDVTKFSLQYVYFLHTFNSLSLR